MNKKTLIILVAIIVILGGTVAGLLLTRNNTENKVITTPKDGVSNLPIESASEKEESKDTKENVNAEETSKWSDKINKTKSITGIGYKATIQNDGSVRVEFDSDIKEIYSQDLQVLIHNLQSTKKAISLFAGNAGTGVEPLICIIYEDGTAGICNIYMALEKNLLKLDITKEIKAGSKIVGFEGGMYNDFDCTYAVTENGEKIRVG